MIAPRENVHILLAFASAKRQDEIERLLHNAAFRDLWEGMLITDVDSIPLAQKTLAEEEVDICIIGSQFGEEEQDFLIRSVTRRVVPGKTLMVPVSPSEDKAILLKLVQAGAHGILVEPITLESLHRVLETSLRKHASGEASEREQLSNLPFLLEHLSERMRELADKVRERDPESSVAANPKLVQEALLGIIGSDASTDEETLERLAEFLLKGAKQSD